MSKPNQNLIVLTRAIDDSIYTQKALNNYGYSSIIEPMLEFLSLTDNKTSVLNYTLSPQNKEKAIIVTSFNAIKALDLFGISKDIPIITIGAKSAKRAEDIGFSNVRFAKDNVFDLIDYINKNYDPSEYRFLYASSTKISENLDIILNNKGYNIIRIPI